MDSFEVTLLVIAAVALAAFGLMTSYVVRLVRRRPGPWMRLAGVLVVIAGGAAIVAVALVAANISVHW